MRVHEALELFDNIPKIRKVLATCWPTWASITCRWVRRPPLCRAASSTRVKLAAELARPSTGKTLYVLDEPTTGLHFDDIHKLLDVLNRLVDLGNTVIVVEHNLDVIRRPTGLSTSARRRGRPAAGWWPRDSGGSRGDARLTHRRRTRPGAGGRAARRAAALRPVRRRGREVAQLAEDGRTVMVVIHSVANLANCDRLLVLVPGGKVAYFGTPADGLRHFGHDDWAEIFQDFEAQPDRDWAADYRRAVDYARYTSGPLQALGAAEARPDASAARAVAARRRARPGSRSCPPWSAGTRRSSPPTATTSA